MSSNKHVSVKLNNLYARQKKLSVTEIESVFGGCAGSGTVCHKDSDCCGDMTCSNSLSGNGKTCSEKSGSGFVPIIN